MGAHTHAPGSQCGFPTPGRVPAQRRAALAPTRPGQGLRGAGARRLAESKGRPGYESRRQALQARRPGLTPRRTAGPGPGTRDTRASQPPGRGGRWWGGRGFPESVSPLPSKLPGTQVLGSGAGWTMAQSPQSVPGPRHPEATRAVTSARRASELRPLGLPAPSSGGRSAGPLRRARGSSEGGREGGSWAGGWPECTE